MTDRARKMAATKAERAASRARIEAAQAATRAVVESGTCPTCGAGVHRNLSLTGWWQCDQFGAETHRKDAAKPACSWQGFTS